MSIKQKLLEIFDETDLSELGEEILVDILLSQLKSKEDEIKRLRVSNFHERAAIKAESVRMREEHSRMRRDPLFCTEGEYVFYGLSLPEGHHVYFIVKGSDVSAFQRAGKVDYAMARIHKYGE